METDTRPAQTSGKGAPAKTNKDKAADAAGGKRKSGDSLTNDEKQRARSGEHGGLEEFDPESPPASTLLETNHYKFQRPSACPPCP